MLVCAPAGGGKTMLLRSWLQVSGEQAAWASVERGEQDAQRFWLSVVEEVNRAVGGQGPLEPVGPSPRFVGEAVVTRVLAGLRALGRPIDVVIDDLADLLRLELRRPMPGEIDLLRRAAAQWHERHGSATDAIEDAKAVEDWSYASGLLAANHVALVLDGRSRTVRAVLSRFPPGMAAQDARAWGAISPAALMHPRRGRRTPRDLRGLRGREAEAAQDAFGVRSRRRR